MPSIFSRIVSGELPAYKVAEDDHHLAFLDITPLVEGHTLVIPKKETDYIFDLPPTELAALHQFAQRVAKGVRAAVPCRRIGVAVIGLEVPHAHIHLIPMNSVSDMNFANPKIKVAEARMKELAAAISAQVPAAETTTAAAATLAPQDSKGGRETTEASAAATPAANGNDATLSQLQQLTQGLVFMSESEAALEPVSYTAPAGGLTDAALAQLAGVPAGTTVEKQELTYFLRNHTADEGVLGNAELANRFKALQMYLKQELNEVQVYRFGSGPQVPVLVLGEAEGGKLAGFKTVLTET
ncbi:histidine triad (HIT) family protein [Hymenobacter luteus]|uniref:Histidine triad (HIT) family protein n=2 Tax=Hymenobacter TaxID=89966 RepID=A0A7W9WBD5_9BACT|nr:nuclease A inhibitor family protein [Hymenobacter latericoloratus]MBB4601483.1 histidine triad (HIT) family protein [Hymenobacter latericoloratus]MBB6058310.1 histidine triad (HIT) family protein [Hymenobacter luteus]